MLHDALRQLPFVHTSTVSANDSFFMQQTGSIYLEPEAPLRSRWAWADGHITPFHTHSYLYMNGSDGAPEAPPLGLRSAPPLGGLGTGTFELRADGTLCSVTVENASPAGSAKTAVLEVTGTQPSAADSRAAMQSISGQSPT